VISLHQDFRYAARRLRRTPGFTIAAVLTLALGIAAHTAFFSVVNAIAFKPIPVARLDNVYSVQAVRPTGDREPAVSLAGLRALERERPADAVAVAAVGFEPVQRLVHAPGRSDERGIQTVSGGFAAAFDLRAQHGRWIGPDDDRDGALQRVAVVSDGLWHEWFGADPGIVERSSITIFKTSFRIIGVAPAGFVGLHARTGVNADVWIPLAAWLAAVDAGPLYSEVLSLNAFVRSRAAATGGAASLQGTVHAILAGQPGPKEPLPPDPTARPKGVVLREKPTVSHALVPARDALESPELNRVATVLLALSALVLLAASANFANLLVARNRARTGELAVRLTLGAGRWRAVRVLLGEATLIGALAGVTGLTLGLAFTSAFATTFPMLGIGHSHRLSFDFGPDALVVLSVLAVAVRSAASVGLATAWRATRAQPVSVLASASGLSAGSTVRGGRSQMLLVALQVTSAVLLVMAAGLFVERVRAELTGRRHIHYDPAPLTLARVNLSLHDYPESRGSVFFDRVLAEARALPGVERAALATDIPPGSRTVIQADDPPGGRAGESPRAYTGFTRVSPGFFATVGLDLRAGRDFGPGDGPGAPLVAILTESAADALWPGQDPIGKRLVLERQTVTVVGVSPNLVSGLTGPREEFPGSERFPATRPSNHVFVPLAQHYTEAQSVIVRSPSRGQVEALRAAVNRIDEHVAVVQAATVSSLLDRIGALWGAAAVMLTIAAVALAIAMLGVYGVVSFFVSTRTREFGIRLALGATPRGLMKLVFDYSLHIVIVGLLPAVFIAAVGSRLIESRQFDLMPNEISTWVIVPLLLVATGLVAGYIPARRAARTDPNVCLREL
jgi:predicted permease